MAKRKLTRARFDALRAEHGALSADSLWRALLQGSVQGALYAADCAARAAVAGETT